MTWVPNAPLIRESLARAYHGRVSTTRRHDDEPEDLEIDLSTGDFGCKYSWREVPEPTYPIVLTHKGFMLKTTT